MNGITVKVSAFSRADSNGAWGTAYLGVYPHGLGVTNSHEGNGDNNRHTVGNLNGYRDYVLFEFSTPIIIDQAYLDFVVNDSDMAAWYGTKTDPINNHNTLSDSFLSGLGTREDNDTTSTSPRWADINSSNKIGNVLVLAASTQDTTPDDMFKIHMVKFNCSGCPTINVNPSTLPNGRRNIYYSQTLTASGGSSPYTFTKATGSLPGGMSLSTGGVLSGTPTATGTFTFSVQATASNGCIGTRSYSLVITYY